MPDEKNNEAPEKKQIIKYGLIASSVFRSTTNEYHIWTLEEIKAGDEAVALRTELQLNPDKTIYLYSDSALDAGHYYASHSSILQGNPRQSFYGSNERSNKKQSEEVDVNSIIFELNQSINIEDIEDVRKFLSIIKKATRAASLTRNDKIEKSLLLFQKNHFNSARKAYFRNAKNELWEKNIEVSMSGRDITFTGYMFVDNKVKKDTFLELKDELINLRFKTVGFSVFDGDGKTYWELNSKKDNEI